MAEKKQKDEKTEEATELGLRGTEVDTTPNENYTIAGVVAGKPVPEAQKNPAVARREAVNPEALG